MLGSPAIRNLIREAKIPQITSMIQMGTKMGMVLMRDSLNRLYENGEISAETLRELLMTSSQSDEESASMSATASKRMTSSNTNSF
ncbi:MAG: hypothetical protein K2Q14_05520, partial [Gammaproteobacteria bacterium]|nr:hypothetical protein [Gammaproteobacteria bacterium]